MSIISIPTHKITEEAMGEGWANWYEAACEFAAYLNAKMPEMIADDGDKVEFLAEVTNDSGCVNNACAYVTVDDEESESLSFRVQNAKETLWDRFCNERGDLAA